MLTYSALPIPPGRVPVPTPALDLVQRRRREVHAEAVRRIAAAAQRRASPAAVTGAGALRPDSTEPVGRDNRRAPTTTTV